MADQTVTPGRKRPSRRHRRARSISSVSRRTSRAWSRKAARRSPPISSRARTAPSRPSLPTRSPTWSRRSGMSPNTGSPTRSAPSRCRRTSARRISTCGPRQCKRMAGEAAAPVVAPDPRDKRFADPEWSSNQFYDFLKQAYLLTTQWADQLVRNADLDQHTRQKAEFYVRQIGNAISPSNFVLTNPELMRDTLSENAENLVRGMHMLAEDIEAGHGKPEDPPVRCIEIRRRQEPRAHARQGDLPERPDAADPVRAHDRERAEAAAADHSALDQQVLHPRSQSGKILHQVVRRTGAHRVRDLVGQSRRAPRGEKLRGLHARGPARGARCRSRR